MADQHEVFLLSCLKIGLKVLTVVTDTVVVH